MLTLKREIKRVKLMKSIAPKTTLKQQWTVHIQKQQTTDQYTISYLWKNEQNKQTRNQITKTIEKTTIVTTRNVWSTQGEKKSDNLNKGKAKTKYVNEK